MPGCSLAADWRCGGPESAQTRLCFSPSSHLRSVACTQPKPANVTERALIDSCPRCGTAPCIPDEQTGWHRRRLLYRRARGRLRSVGARPCEQLLRAGCPRAGGPAADAGSLARLLSSRLPAATGPTARAGKQAGIGHAERKDPVGLALECLYQLQLLWIPLAKLQLNERELVIAPLAVGRRLRRILGQVPFGFRRRSS